MSEQVIMVISALLLGFFTGVLVTIRIFSLAQHDQARATVSRGAES